MASGVLLASGILLLHFYSDGFKDGNEFS